MKELIRHIEALLIENDCVILPNFGGFITSHAQALWVEEEKIYLPPYRSVGFNPQLKINDGLLVQSYMITHDATYPEATRLVDTAIDELAELLYKEGEVEFNGIGVLQRTIAGEYCFTPSENGTISPDLYGLSPVGLPLLSELPEQKAATLIPMPAISVQEEPEPVKETSTPKKDKNRLVISIRRDWLVNAAGIAAAIILFFSLSTPVGNTYIEEENYASLGNLDVLKQFERKSMVTSLAELPRTTLATPKVATTSTPKAVSKQPKASNTPSAATANHQPKEATTAGQVSVKTQTGTAAAKQTTATKQTVAAKQPATVTPKATTASTTAQPETPAVAKPRNSKTYNVIIASVASESDAQQAIKRFEEQGKKGTFLISGGGRFRIALAAYDNEAEAYKKAAELNDNKEFNGAWVLTTRN